MWTGHDFLNVIFASELSMSKSVVSFASLIINTIVHDFLCLGILHIIQYTSKLFLHWIICCNSYLVSSIKYSYKPSSGWRRGGCPLGNKEKNKSIFHQNCSKTYIFMSCQNTRNKEYFFFLNCANHEFRLNGSVLESCAIYTEPYLSYVLPPFSLLTFIFHVNLRAAGCQLYWRISVISR